MLKSIEFLRGKSRGRVGGCGGLSPLAPVILGLVHRILLQQISNPVNKFALLLNKSWFTQDSWDKPKNDWCWGRRYGTFSQSGRSMIEMLGVLAIIGVLSVGGIAGYSKAMEQYKINKAIDGYSHILFGITEHLQYIKKQKNGTHFNEFFRNINLLPPEWPYLHDNLGNYFNIYLRSNDLVFDMYLGGWVTNEDGKSVSANFSHSLCEKFVQNIATPLHSSLKYVLIFPIAVAFYGDSYCNGADKKCFNQLSLSDINKYCSGCAKDDACAVVLTF